MPTCFLWSPNPNSFVNSSPGGQVLTLSIPQFLKSQCCQPDSPSTIAALTPLLRSSVLSFLPSHSHGQYLNHALIIHDVLWISSSCTIEVRSYQCYFECSVIFGSWDVDQHSPSCGSPTMQIFFTSFSLSTLSHCVFLCVCVYFE